MRALLIKGTLVFQLGICAITMMYLNQPMASPKVKPKSEVPVCGTQMCIDTITDHDEVLVVRTTLSSTVSQG